ncbi:MAG: phosphoglucosamine mutase, partial [Flavobacteriaceae bacterium]|nr:phosphoglucosamine mutase [Flavobacteriaceae bacterium]
MTLISSISGIRGTIGGTPGANLTPLDALRFSMAYGTWLLKQHQSVTVVIGRDARLSGPMIQQIVQQTLIGLGINIIDLGLSTTPTVEMEVVRQNAQGGVILTASHNPKEWNALKLLNSDGEFLNASAGNQINALAQQLNSISFAAVDALGTLIEEPKALDHHIDAILNLSLVDSATVAKRSFKVVVDGVNSSGGIAVPALLERMGVE